MFGFEIGFLKALESIRSDFLNSFFEFVTMFGEETLLIVFMTIVYFMFDKQLARRIFFITATSLGVNGIVKNFVKIPRPWTTGEITCVRPDTATGYSFPSGHTQNIATWSSAFAFKFRKRAISVMAVVATALVGFSRMYLGAHYPSDVAAGIIIGVGISFIASFLYDSIDNKNTLHLAAILIYAPFAVFFMLSADAEYADFYKLYGMLTGFYAAVLFEDRFVSLDCSGALWKRIIRVIIGVAVAFAVKEGLKEIFVTDIVMLALLLGFVRYFALVFCMLALCPLIFKKLSL